MKIRKLTAGIVACMLATTALPISTIADYETAQALAYTVTDTQFGAKGNDTLDDAPAIQRALDMAAGSDEMVTIKIPSGTYYINSELKIHSNTTLLLSSGTVMKRGPMTASNRFYFMVNANDSSGTGVGYTRSHDIKISGGKWDGNVTSRRVTKGLIKMTNAKNITLENTTFTNCCGTHFVLLDGINGINVKGCTFSNFIEFVSRNNGQDYREQVGADYTYRGTEALHIDFVEKSGNETGTPCKNVEVSDCTFSKCTTAIGTHHTYDYMKADNINIHGNIFKDCYYYCVDGASFTNFKMYNNKAYNTGGLCYVQNTSGSVNNNYIETRLSLTGSMYSHDNFADSTRPSLNGIRICDASYDLTIKNNTIKGATENGIYVLDKSKNITISNNNISNAYKNLVLIRNSQVTAKNNSLSKAGLNGFSVQQSSKLTAINNVISYAKEHGFFVKEKASVTATSNYIHHNTKCGFMFISNSKGNVTQNNLRNNTGANIYINSAVCTFKNNGSDKSDSYGSKKCLRAYSFKIPSKQIANGSQIKPAVTSSLKKGTDYTVTYGRNIIGDGIVNITGKGNFAGSFSIHFKILPKRGAVSSLASRNSKLIVRISPDITASGYQIKYSSMSKDVSSGKTITIGSNSAATKTINAISGRTYYVIVRSYVTINGVRNYGSWSKVKSVKIV